MINSPCKNKCELDDNYICKGCFRSLDEIDIWHKASGDKRKEILINIANRKLKKDEDYYGFPF